MPTLSQYEYIIAVDNHRHFATAAQACFVTQPTLSMQIRRLEEELGIRIFDRSRQPVIPTDIGRQVIAQARTVVQAAARIPALIEEFKGEVGGELRLGIIPTLAPYLLPLFVGQFVRAYPKIALQVRECTTEQIIQALQRDELDVGLLVTPLHEARLTELPLFHEPIHIYTHKNHAFAQAESLPLKSLESSDIWLLSEGHCFRYQMLNLCALRHKLDEQHLPFEYESGSLESLKRLVEIEGGFTLLPDLATLYFSEQERALLRPIVAPTPMREVSLVYLRSFAKSRLLDLLAQNIKAAVPAHLLEQEGQVVEWK